MIHSAVWTLVAALALAKGPQAANGPQADPANEVLSAKAGDAFIPQCQVFLIDDVQVPARETGALAAVSVKEGDLVRAGQLLARIDDRKAQFDKLAAELKRDAALAKAEDDIEIRYAQASLGVADAEWSQSEDINRRSPGTVSVAEMRRLKLTRERSALQIDRSQLDVKVANLTADIEKTAVAAAEDSIERRQIIAPFEGLVLDLLGHEAEWVNAGEPVLRMVRLDRLRVEGFFHMHQFNPEEMVHRPVTIELERARGEIVRLPGKVVFISPMVQAGDTYRIRAEVQNRMQDNYWLLGPGMTVAMTVHIHQPPAATAAAVSLSTQ